MNDLTISMILRLVDQVTAPARQVLAALGDIDKVTAAAGGRLTEWSSAQAKASKERMGALASETAAGMAMGASLVGFLQPAIRFEEAMAGVNKVMEFEEADAILKLGQDIQALTTKRRLPMAATQIADIVEAAGQAGLIDFSLGDDQVRAQAIAFARDAAQMGVAFDMAGAQAGEAMAQWRARLELTRAESELLGDATNHLSNHMNASAAAIVSVLGRQGAMALSTGLMTEEVAALSAAFVAAAPSPEIAATGMKNFVNALTKGASVTGAQKAVYAAIGLDPEQVAEQMVTDAQATIELVVDGIRALPEAQQNAAIGQLFGEEAKGAITPLIQNAELLSGAFELVADRTSFAGSMLAEYEVRAKTTANNQQLILSGLNAVAATIGTSVLPAFNELLSVISPLLSDVTEWVRANPELTATLVKVAAGLVATKLALTLLQWPIQMAILLFARAGQVMGVFMSVAGRVMTAVKLLSVIGFHTLRIAIGAVGHVLLMVGRLFLANPIVAAITAIAGAAWLIYDNWDQVWAWLMRKVDAVSAAFDEGLLNGVLKLLAEFNPFTLLVEAAGGLLGKLGEIIGLPDKIVEAFYAMDLVGAGVAMIQSLRDGALSVVGSMVEAIEAKLEAVVPDWMQSAWRFVSGGEDEPVQARASGGIFGPGPVLVGERGPEFGYATQGGYIAHNGALQRMVSLASRAQSIVNGLQIPDLTSAVPSLVGAPSDTSGAIRLAAPALDTRPALRAPQQKVVHLTMEVGGIRIDASGPGGADPEAIAREVTRQLRAAARDARNVLHDGEA
ncbi:MAG: phage tail tape measure protein [Pseudomonadota bacterium]